MQKQAQNYSITAQPANLTHGFPKGANSSPLFRLFQMKPFLKIPLKWVILSWDSLKCKWNFPPSTFYGAFTKRYKCSRGTWDLVISPAKISAGMGEMTTLAASLDNQQTPHGGLSSHKAILPRPCWKGKLSALIIFEPLPPPHPFQGTVLVT